VNTYDVDDEHNVYSLVLVPYIDGDSLNVRVGMGFPKVDDERDKIHVDMISTLTLLATAFKLMQSDEKLNKKLFKHYKETLKDFTGNTQEEHDPVAVEYLDETKKVIKPTFGKKDK